MKVHHIGLAGALACLALLAVIAYATPARAQAALPTAPGAQRAPSGGLTQAHASLPGEPGKSPLEPYLVTWLLPISGILTVVAGIYVDRRVQAIGRRKAMPERRS